MVQRSKPIYQDKSKRKSELPEDDLTSKTFFPYIPSVQVHHHSHMWFFCIRDWARRNPALSRIFRSPTVRRRTRLPAREEPYSILLLRLLFAWWHSLHSNTLWFRIAHKTAPAHPHHHTRRRQKWSLVGNSHSLSRGPILSSTWDNSSSPSTF